MDSKMAIRPLYWYQTTLLVILLCALFGQIAMGQTDHSQRHTTKPTIHTEVEVGDPGLPGQRITFDEHYFQTLTVVETKLPCVDGKALGKKMIEVAHRYLGVSYTHNSAQVAQFLALFGLPLKTDHGAWMPYCAAGACFVMCQAFCEVSDVSFTDANVIAKFHSVRRDVERCYFRIDPLCPMLKRKAKQQWQSSSQIPAGRAKAGWLVLFNWHHGSKPEHVGIVEKADAKYVYTTEFNTYAAGIVAQRQREYRYVVGYIKTY